MSDRYAFRAKGQNAQRSIIGGKTGSGKTTLAKEIALAASRLVWFDVKGLNDPGLPVHYADEFYELVTIQAPSRGGMKPRLVARGKPAALLAVLATTPQITIQARRERDSFPAVDQLDAVAEAAYHVGNLLFVLDDAMGVVGSQPPTFVHRLLTEGRARGIGWMAIVQRLHGIPLVFLSEAEHAIFFVMNDAYDLERISAGRGADVAAAVAQLRPCESCLEGPTSAKPHRHDWLWHVLGQSVNAPTQPHLQSAS